MTIAEHEISTTPTPHRWTVEDFLRAAEFGCFSDQRVELIDGKIIDMPPQKDAHAFAVSNLVHELMRVFPPPFWVKIQATVRLNDFAGPEPDIAVLSGPPSPPAATSPSVLLVVEVSDTTLNYDRGEKASLYAANAIADYWIINLAARQILVHRQPVEDASQSRGWRYESVAILQPADRLAPLAKMSETINMSEVLR